MYPSTIRRKIKMNIKLVSLIFAVLLIAGCTVTSDDPPSIREKHNPLPLDYYHCKYYFYEIVYVDDILIQNCYAIKQPNWHDEIYVQVILESNESLNGALIWRYSIRENRHCTEIEPLQKVYCYRDLSECLLIEDNICSLISFV
jgi:hypothetical protein